MKDFTIMRGDKRTLDFIFVADYSTKKLYFTAKYTRDQTDDRLIEKKNVAAGGTDAELKAVYDTGKGITFISVYLDETDTADLIKDVEYDLYDEDDVLTIETGKIYLKADVRTPYDGFALPEDAVRFLQLDASSGADYDLVQVRVIDGEKKLVFITLSELKNQLNSI